MLESFICQNCVADKYLRAEIISRGDPVPDCPICKRGGGLALSTDDELLARIVRALIRLNFSEWDYNTHLGGMQLRKLVFSSKLIFDYPEDADESAFDAAFQQIEGMGGWYPQSDEEISLGGGYWDGRVLFGLRAERDRAVENLVNASLQRNWHEIEPEARQLIRSLKNDITLKLNAGQKYYRGRIGVHSRLKKVFCNPSEFPFTYLPYSGKDIGHPPMLHASEGRFNRTRVSILYLASDRETAVAELRPHPGHLISTASFRLERDMVVANFGDLDIRKFLHDDRLRELRTILSLADILNVPVQPEHRFLYAATQLIADAVRAEGYNGLIFNSSVAFGFNLVCFDPNDCTVIASSEEIHEVRSLAYELSAVPALQQDEDESDYIKDEDSPLATLLHGVSLRAAPR
ncbi:RES family NAD+ phosphorylase [Ottowia thiooxydans]|uniref:RES family NAD+ phosphorylase n=1 Tax=Ottowia thiooxydans TaxID=219182 RepID=UPI00040F0D38|nr:RES family NAD+ phosphorylase [Ottowia thiooxydans]